MMSFQKIFEHVAVLSGDRISFKLEVYDNRWPQKQVAVSPLRSLFVYQQDLDDLSVLGLSLGQGRFGRGRIGKSKRATSVKAPAGMRIREKVWNEYDAKIDTTARPPRVSRAHAQAVRDYLRLISTAVREDEEE